MRSSGSKAARTAARALTLALTLLASGCGGTIDIASTPLAGTIGGEPWSLVSAESSAFLSKDSPTFFVTAYAVAVTPCAGAASSATGNELLLNIPKTAGDYRVNPSLSQTFYLRASNLNLAATTNGRIRVDQVTATMVSGGAHVAFDGANEVDGVFSVPLCPP